MPEQDKPLKRAIIFTLAILGWVTIFAAGAHHPAGPVLDRMGSASTGQYLTLIPEAILLWGWTNIALLSALAGLAGAGGHPSRRDLASGAARGLFVFFLAMTGQLIFATGYAESVFRFPGQEVYFRIAGLVSVGAFIAGWSPEILAATISNIAKRQQA